MTTSARRLDFEAALPRAAALSFSAGSMHVALVDGRELSVPLAWFPRLAAADDRQRRAFELLDDGVEIRWEEIDEDISVPNLLGIPYENS